MPNDWAEVFAPLVERWQKRAVASREEAGRIRRTIMDPTDAEERCNVRAEVWDDVADELLAHLREKVVPLLEASEAMRNHEMGHPSGFTRWDAAKAKLLAKGDVVSDWGISGALSVLPKGAKVPDAG